MREKIEEEMNLALIKIKNAGPEFQKKIAQHIRVELCEKISDLKMSEERKSFFLHQISNTHEIVEVISLVLEMNDLQISEKPLNLQFNDSVKLSKIIEDTKRDLLFLRVSATGIYWMKHSFSPILNEVSMFELGKPA